MYNLYIYVYFLYLRCTDIYSNVHVTSAVPLLVEVKMTTTTENGTCDREKVVAVSLQLLISTCFDLLRSIECTGRVPVLISSQTIISASS